MTEEGFIPPHGGYANLLSYRKAEIVYDATVYFCDRFIDRRSRTHDQMVQAAPVCSVPVRASSPCRGHLARDSRARRPRYKRLTASLRTGETFRKGIEHPDPEICPARPSAGTKTVLNHESHELHQWGWLVTTRPLVRSVLFVVSDPSVLLD